MMELMLLQIDEEEEFQDTRKFLTAVPIVLFVTVVALVVCCSCLLPFNCFLFDRSHAFFCGVWVNCTPLAYSSLFSRADCHSTCVTPVGIHLSRSPPVPSLLTAPRFLLTVFYTHHDATHFAINFAIMSILVVQKLPQTHGVCWWEFDVLFVNSFPLLYVLFVVCSAA
jgi:hypothetical protein